MKLFFGCIALFLLFSHCGSSSRDCTTDGECFSGEICTDGSCTDPAANNQNNANNGNNANNSNNGNSNNGNSNNSNNGNNSNNTSSQNNTTGMLACQIDPFGNQCQDDMYEDNDFVMATGGDQNAVPYTSDSWCNGTDPVDHTRTFNGTFCANDGGDSFRFPIRMWAPVCVTAAQATLRVTVTIETECDPSFIKISPYDFFRDPIRNDLCTPEFPDVQCTQSEDGSVRTFEFLQDVNSNNQIWDSRIFIEAEDDIQFEYSVQVEIVS